MWHLHISALENTALENIVKYFPTRIFPKTCGAKLIALTNEPVARTALTSSGQNKISPQPVESIDDYRYGLRF